MDEYFGTRFGKLRVPAYTFARTIDFEGYEFDQVSVSYNPESFVPPQDIEEVKAEIVAPIEKKVKENGGVFFDGGVMKLTGCSYNDNQLTLDTQKSSYFVFQSTNVALDKKVLDNKTKTVREKYVTDPYSWDDVLANPLGVSVLVISEPENKMVFTKRSEAVGVFPGFHHDLAAGGMDPEKDMINGVPHPFRTAQREVQEEAGIDYRMEDFRLQSLARNHSTLHPELYGEIRTNMKVNEILDAPKIDKFESMQITEVDFTPESVIPYLSGYIRSDDPYAEVGWVPAGALNVVESLIKEYGREKVERTINDFV